MIGGGAIRSASLLEYLRQRFEEVDVITFRQPGGTIPVYAHAAIDLPHHSRAPQARVVRNVKRAILGRPPLIDRFSGFEEDLCTILRDKQYQLAIVEHFWCAQYAPLLRKHTRTLVLDLHNIESAWHRSLAASEGLLARPLYSRFAASCEQLERRILPAFDTLLVTSADDAAEVQKLSPGTHRIVYPNALPVTAAPPRWESDAVIFTGNLEYQPNVTAVRYFAQKIWPQLQRRYPGLIWQILGKNEHAIRSIVRDLPNIHLIGPVDDAIPHIANAKIAIVPLLSGSGTRIKVLEAWAAATPVIATRIGAEGLKYQQNEIVIRDDPDEFIAAVTTLLDDEGLRRRVGENGRRRYELCYTWQAAWEALSQLT